MESRLKGRPILLQPGQQGRVRWGGFKGAVGTVERVYPDEPYLAGGYEMRFAPEVWPWGAWIELGNVEPVAEGV